MRRRALLLLTVIAVAAACTELVTSPGRCPDYCPGGKIVTVESLLTAGIVRDSSFIGYIQPQVVGWMVAEEIPGQLDSRPVFQTRPVPNLRFTYLSGDTTTVPIIVDSIKLTLTFTRRDTTVHNVVVEFYRLPLPVDSNSTFATLAPQFGSPFRTVNLDTLLAIPGRRDSVTGDSVLSDTLGRATVAFKLDTTQVPFVAADSGRAAFGLRITGDAPTTVLVTAFNNSDARGPHLTWFNSIDSAGTKIKKTAQDVVPEFDSFVFDPPTAPLDSNLTVGGVPTARTLLRVNLPRGIRDSTQIIRASLYLVPVAPAFGTVADSFFIGAYRVHPDLGAKSPLDPSDTTSQAQSVALGSGAIDTVRLELTNMLRFWQTDTLVAPALYLRVFSLDSTRTNKTLQGLEGSTFAKIRFYSTRSPGFRPALRVTYVPRVNFGAP